ncbi:MAG: O-antigen ligase family protein [Desulfuromonadales bacterium]|nr:O-antigen ligase family protein [Desulfuromonadales bacterium]
MRVSDRMQDRIFASLVFLFPLGMASISHYASTLFFLMVLTACWYACRERLPLELEYRQLLFWMLLFCGAVLLSLVNVHDLAEGIDHTGKILYLLALFPLLLVSGKLSVPLVRPLVAGLVVAGPLNLLIALYSVYVTGYERAQGAYHPIIFGSLMMLGGLVLSACVLTGITRSRLKRALVFFSMCCFFIASFLSGSRGALLAFPLVIPVLLTLSSNKLNIALVSRIAVIVVFFLGVLGLAEKNNVFLGGKRQTINNIIRYSSGEKINTPLGTRLQLWGVAYEMFKEHPLIGSGYGDFTYEVDRRIETKQTKLGKSFRHAHSIYFDQLGSTGLVGLSTMVLSLFFFPLKFFLRLHPRRGPDSLPKVAGVAMLLGFAIFGLTEGWLTRSPLVIAYLAYSFILISSSRHQLTEMT